MQTAWFTCTIVCSNANTSIVATSATVTVGGVVTNTVPYFENFQNLALNNTLPNCSWLATGLGTTCLTYTAPGNAAFYYNPPGTNYFYTNGIQLSAGITYSGGLTYKTDNTGGQNWSNLSLLVGSIQSPAGQFTVASISGAVVSPVWASLTNTFTVPTSGIYYLAVRATGSNTGTSQYLSWDDLFINLPCTFNTHSVSVLSNITSVCGSRSFVLSASGADTYTWNSGSNSAVITATAPGVSVPGALTYSVGGTNTLTGCTAVSTFSMPVNPTPTISVITSPASTLCSGNSVTLTAGGGNTYTWSTGLVGDSLVVAPSGNTTYSVLGSNAYNCDALASQQVTVYARPSVTAIASTPTLCSGSFATLYASSPGVSNFIWTSPAGTLTGNQVTVSPATTTNYSVTGVNSVGCSGGASIIMTVSPLPDFTLSPIVHMCAGKNATLKALSNDPLAYIWLSSGVAMAGNPVTVSPSVSTIYSLTAITGDGCVAVKTLTVVVEAVPVFAVTGTGAPVCAGESVLLMAIGDALFDWNGLGSGNSIMVSPSETQSSTLTATSLSNGCTASLLFSIIVNPCAQVHEAMNDMRATVYPNPGAGDFTLDLSGYGEGRFSVFDVMGNHIGEWNVERATMHIDLTDQKAGMYFCVIRGGGAVQVIRIIKE
jgi:hypothetical protein